MQPNLFSCLWKGEIVRRITFAASLRFLRALPPCPSPLLRRPLLPEDSFGSLPGLPVIWERPTNLDNYHMLHIQTTTTQVALKLETNMNPSHKTTWWNTEIRRTSPSHRFSKGSNTVEAKVMQKHVLVILVVVAEGQVWHVRNTLPRAPSSTVHSYSSTPTIKGHTKVQLT